MKLTLIKLVPFGLMLACSAAQGQAAVADIQKADDAIMAGLPIACSIADSVDPALATVVCGIVSSTGELVQVVTQKLSSPAVAAAVVAAHPVASPAVASSLKAKAVKQASCADGGPCGAASKK